jgi:hypothetical protein
MESLNELIGLARAILDTRFDIQAFLTWRELSFLCLLGLLGPLHHYTKSFCRFTEQPNELALLAGEGLLYAAREQMAGVNLNGAEPSEAIAQSSQRTFTPWIRRSKKWLPLTVLRF